MSRDDEDRGGRRAFLRGGFLRAFGRRPAEEPAPRPERRQTERQEDTAQESDRPDSARPDPARTAEERAEAARRADARRQAEREARAEAARRAAAAARAEATRQRRADAAEAIQAALGRVGRPMTAAARAVGAPSATTTATTTTATAASLAAVGAAAEAREAPAERPPPPLLPLVRPPGAVDEATFLARCEPGCNKCARVCPVQAIHPANPRMRGARGTPVLTPSRVPCTGCPDHDVPPCIAACPTGALDVRASRQIGLAHVFEGACLAHRSLVCTTCRERCPTPGAIVFQAGKPVVQAVLCTGCGQCAYTCPAPQRAIDVLPLRQRRTPPAPPGAAEPWTQE